MPLMDIITGRRRRALFAGDWTSHLQDPDLAQLLVADDWTEASGEVSLWNDSSGNGRHITFDSTRRPTDNTTYATFNGTSDIGYGSDHMADAGDAGGCQGHIVIDNFSEGLDDTVWGEFAETANEPYYQVISAANSVDMRMLMIDDAGDFFAAIGNDHEYNFGWSSDPNIVSFIDFETHFAIYVNGYFQTSAEIDRAGASTVTPDIMSIGGRKRNSTHENFFAMDLHRLVASHTASLATMRQHVALLGSDYGIDVYEDQELDHANVVVSGSCSDNSVAGNLAVESSGSGVGHAYIPFAGTGTGAANAGWSAFKENATNAGSIEFQYADDVSGTNGSAFWTASAALPISYFGGRTQTFAGQSGIRVRLNNNSGGAVSISSIQLGDVCPLT